MKYKSSAAPHHVEAEPSRELFRDALIGLSRRRKELPCKYFYDQHGSDLFERICELEEYYPTRTELAIMRQNLEEISSLLGSGCLLIEPGAGSGLKTRMLLAKLEEPAGYIPIDISEEHLANTVRQLQRHFPRLQILPIYADFMQELDLPRGSRTVQRRVTYFPGSTIGNLVPEQARSFLKWAAGLCGSGGALLIGVDLKKDPVILERAYNDGAGITAEFNRNLLVRLNRELGADFNIDLFSHDARYNPEEGRIEMHLVSQARQFARIGNVEILFEKGETIHTESCYKYDLEGFRALAAESGFRVEKVWTDDRQWFSVQYLTVP